MSWVAAGRRPGTWSPAVILAELYRGAGRNHAVDACLAGETGGGVVLTGDPDDLASLAAPYPNITVQSLP